MEGLQVVKYTPFIPLPATIVTQLNTYYRYYEKQQFREHHDWFQPGGPDMDRAGNRMSSFFVYLVANCTGGTTTFPHVPRPQGKEWCEALKCQNEAGEEIQWLEVEPKIGTAIFWYNLDPSGVGEENTLHAGTPVKDGIKIGLNIWTREGPFRSW
jgi:prolyl 4-hydroxylase